MVGTLIIFYTYDEYIWLSVDPLAEKFPNVSSYVYCHDNLVKFIDPDGKDPYLVYNGAKHVLQIYDDNKTPGNFKDDKLIGSYQAHNNVTRSSQGKWEDGNYKMDTKTHRHTHSGADGKNRPDDSSNGKYGKGGSYTAATLKETTTGKVRTGMSVHAGREYKPLEERVTEGCIRTTPEAMTGIDNAIKNFGPLQSILIQNNRESGNSNSVNNIKPGGTDQTFHLKEVTVTAKKQK